MTVTFRVGNIVIENGNTIAPDNLPLATDTQHGTVLVGANIQVDKDGVISVDSASTGIPGIVQLNDTTSSTSTTQALTANQGRLLQDQINALSLTSNLTFAGTIDASTGFMVVVSNEGTIAGFESGSPLPDPDPTNAEYYAIVTVPGTMTPPGGLAEICIQGDWWLSDGSQWILLDIGYNAPYASTTASGVVRLATDAEVQDGTNTTNAVVPSALQSKMSDSTSTESSTTIASSTAVKFAYDAGVLAQLNAAQAQVTANAALPLSGGTMTGNINFVDEQPVDAGTY